MAKRIIYILILVFSLPVVSLRINAQQPSVYSIKRMSFNISGFNNISPVIVSDGIIFCSDKRYSGIEDRTGYDGRRLYNIYKAEKKDTTAYRKPKVIKSERSNKFNNGPLCFAPDGKTVYFTSEVETGKMADNKNFKNHSGIFVADLSGTQLQSIRPFKYNDIQFDVGQPSISKDGKLLCL
jgi:Tol biopolymer transport system component